MKLKKLLSASILGIIAAPFGMAAFATVFLASLLFGGGGSGVMAATMDLSALTLDRDGIDAISEIIFKEKFVSPSWREFMDVQNGIKHDKQIMIADHFNGLGGSVRSDCDTSANPDRLTFSEKTWAPKSISDRWEECADSLRSTFWKKFLAKGNGVDSQDLTQSDYDKFIKFMLEYYMTDDMMYRLIFFTDTAIAAGTGNNLTPDQLKYFNMLNGVFSQLVTIYGTTAARKTASPTGSPENDAATYTLQAFATASATTHPATDWLNKVVKDASMELRGAQNQVIMVTQSVWDQLVDERKAVTNIELAYTRSETGISKMQWNGIDLIAIPTWDRLIRRPYKQRPKMLH